MHYLLIYPSIYWLFPFLFICLLSFFTLFLIHRFFFFTYCIFLFYFFHSFEQIPFNEPEPLHISQIEHSGGPSIILNPTSSKIVV